MKRLTAFLFGIFLLHVAALSAFAQQPDLNLLQKRANDLWAQRIASNRVAAAQYGLASSKVEVPMFDGVQRASVVAMYYTPDKTKMTVESRVKMILSTQMFQALGPMANSIPESTIAETWVWSRGSWFLETGSIKNPFSSNEKPTAIGKETFEFQVLQKQLDLGSHTQGDTIKGTIKFSALRKKVEGIRARGVSGLTLSAPKWTSDTEGTLDFTINTALISEDLKDAKITVEAIGPLFMFVPLTAKDELTVNGRIAGKVRVAQLPQTPEAQQGKFVQVEIENLTSAPFQIERARSLTPNLVVDDARIPVTLAPKQKTTFAVDYRSLGRLMDGDLDIRFSAGVLPSNQIVFPVKAPSSGVEDQSMKPLSRSEVQDIITRAQIEEARRKASGQ